MRNWKLYFLPLTLISISAFGQNTIDQEGTLTTCSDSIFDSGNSIAGYGASEHYVITVCSDGGGNVVNANFFSTISTFDIHESDTLKVYDGDDLTSPLIGSYNNNNSPSAITSSLSNSSGCLTFEFISDSDGNQGDGFTIYTTCSMICQPFESVVTSSSHTLQMFQDVLGNDSLIIDACLGDEILINAVGDYPIAGASPVTYAQSDATTNFSWDYGEGTVVAGQNASMNYTIASGYLSSVTLEDANGCLLNIEVRIRIAPEPYFNGVPYISDDTICLVDQVDLFGAFSDPNDINFSINATSEVVGGGADENEFELPDGDTDSHEGIINVSGFGSAVISDGDDITSFCVELEHSYIGDLEMVLVCPNGTEIAIFNSYDNAGGTGGGQEIIPGGFDGGGLQLGEPLTSTGTGPGVGWNYCWSNSPTLGSFASTFTTNIIPNGVGFGNSMDSSGIYTLDDPAGFDGFIGCPINGDWTLIIRDNWNIDDGYVFGWEINFGITSSDVEPYTTFAQEGDWIQDSTFVSSSNGVTTVQPAAFGDNNYTFRVTDDFGCTHDTIASVYVRPYPIINPYAKACDLQYQFTNTQNASVGVWTATGPGNITFSPSDTDLNPQVTADEYGMYTFSFLETTCSQGVETKILFVPDVTVNIENDTICVIDPNKTFNATFTQDSTVTYAWSPTNETSPRISVHDEGTYEVLVTGFCNFAYDTAFLKIDTCTVLVPNVISPNGDNSNNLLVVEYLDKHPNSHLMIINRWGKTVYENDNYQNDWKGTNKNGKDLAEGVYYYVLTNPEARFEDLKGHITIVR